jgi:hypothetical protein
VLGLSPYTVETHRTNLTQKLGLHSTAEIVLYAVRKGLITPTPDDPAEGADTGAPRRLPANRGS